MVLSALGEFIYHCYMLIYYIIQFAIVIGSLLYGGICKVASLCQNTSVFIKIVLEDNYHHIQDAKTIIAGTSDFFLVNAGKACSAVYTIGVVFRDAVLASCNILCLAAWTFKRSLVLLGEAVWLLFTSPYKLFVLLDELLHYCAKESFEQGRKTAKLCVQAVVDLVHYTTHDVPLEATAGLIILSLIYLHPGPAITLARFFCRAVCFSAHFLRDRARNLLNKLLVKLYRFGEALYLRTLLPLGQLLRSSAINTLPSLGLGRLVLYPHRIVVWLNHRLQLHGRTEESSAALTIQLPPPPIAGRKTPQPNKLGSCIICEDDDRTIVFVPCGHLCVCRVCAESIKQYNPVCPVCRKYIEKQLKVYL